MKLEKELESKITKLAEDYAFGEQRKWFKVRVRDLIQTAVQKELKKTIVDMYIRKNISFIDTKSRKVLSIPTIYERLGIKESTTKDTKKVV